MLIDTTTYLNGQLRLCRAYRQGTNTLICVPTNAQVNIKDDLVATVDHILAYAGDVDPVKLYAAVTKNLRS